MSVQAACLTSGISLADACANWKRLADASCTYSRVLPSHSRGRLTLTQVPTEQTPLLINWLSDVPAMRI